MIQKPKLCKGCKHPQRIFSHGLCLLCWKKQYKNPSTRQELKIQNIPMQNNTRLSEKSAFRNAYVLWGGRWYISGDFVRLNDLTASNFSHVLPKAHNRYPWFKFYPKNIILLTIEQHHIYDKGSVCQMARYLKQHPREANKWKELVALRDCLIAEYSDWITFYPKEFKLE